MFNMFGRTKALTKDTTLQTKERQTAARHLRFCT